MQEYDPNTKRPESDDPSLDSERLQPRATTDEKKYGIPSNYQEKYKKLLGGLDCAEKSAVKMQPNKAFGYGTLHGGKFKHTIHYTMLFTFQFPVPTKET